MKILPRIKLPSKFVRLAIRLFEIESPDIDLLHGRNVEYTYAIYKIAMAQKGKVLDVGVCSANNILPVTLTWLGFEVCGIDIRQFRYDHPQFRFVQGDIRHTNFPDSYFDYVTAISTIEHIGLTRYGEIKEDLEGDKNAIREIARILKPQGRLLLTVPYGISATIKPLHRIYDRAQLVKLTSEIFRIQEELYYARDKEGYWRNVLHAVAEDVRREGRESLALLELEPNRK